MAHETVRRPLLFFFFGLCLSPCRCEDADVEEMDAAHLETADTESLVSLLQTSVTHIPLFGGPGAGPAQRLWAQSGEVDLVASVEQVGGTATCDAINRADERLPLSQVAAAHPDEDLFCHFGYLGLWASECGKARMRHDYVSYLRAIDYSYAVPKSGQEFTVNYEGGTFRSRNQIFLYDDVYCHANRWLRGQGKQTQLTENFTALAALSNAECHNLQGRFNETELSVADLNRRTDEEVKQLRNAMLGRGQAPSVLAMERHAAVKCAMGDLTCDLFYCANWCLRPDGLIGRDDKECSSSD